MERWWQLPGRRSPRSDTGSTAGSVAKGAAWSWIWEGSWGVESTALASFGQDLKGTPCKMPSRKTTKEIDDVSSSNLSLELRGHVRKRSDWQAKLHTMTCGPSVRWMFFGFVLMADHAWKKQQTRLRPAYLTENARTIVDYRGTRIRSM